MKKSWFLSLLLLSIAISGWAASIHVPSDQPTIQAAIDAAAFGDSILVASGRYKEVLRIQAKTLFIIGTGADQCVLHKTAADTLHVLINSAKVHISGMELNGGEYDAQFDYYSGRTSRGIVTNNAQLYLTKVALNQYVNFMVTIHGGSLETSEVTLYSRPYMIQCDIGFDLRGCKAHIRRLQQNEGYIDHTINIWGDVDGYGKSVVTVENSIIRASNLSWGDCIRAYKAVNLVVHDCQFYRPEGGQAPGPAHTGVGINGSEVSAVISHNTFNGLPWGLFYYGGFMNSNRVMVENNTFSNCLSGGVKISGSHYEGIDLGGGPFGSNGYNSFSNPAALDVTLDNSSADIHAHHNWWTSLNPDLGIHDQLDDNTLGRVLHAIKPLPPSLLYPIDKYSNQPVHSKLVWRRIGGATKYDVQLSIISSFRSVVEEASGIQDTSRSVGPLLPNRSYFWRVRGQNRWGMGDWSNTCSFYVTEKGTLVELKSAEGWKTGILPSFPNPANARVIVRFALAQESRVRIEILDLLGRSVEMLEDKSFSAGPHRLVWEAKSNASGTYFIRMSCTGFDKSVKVQLIK